jgi:hypothetical protein
LFMGGVDLKDKKLQPYKTEWKRSTKWYTALFKRLLNISAQYTAFMHYRESYNTKNLNHLAFRLHVKEDLKPPHSERPSSTPTRDKLTARNFVERITPLRKRPSPQWDLHFAARQAEKVKKRNFRVRTVE